ncbi:hypothetical protein PPERSA_10764 [Pseudocohnilembus persalinus]|uniref:Uncharacterized protein n=1 Tax=Pseudocohnilembus persalinus TaxID=266149 RepID=A0A0V0QDI2_PSEPJ|nr:hypothetical protein PPERSA_10764 [Pseudocohnilembus persalinus]|eukprot:KRX00265.1 hypothetical protein PPERSA_10764 [Pseudocohnilembus persalinus]
MSTNSDNYTNLQQNQIDILQDKLDDCLISLEDQRQLLQISKEMEKRLKQNLKEINTQNQKLIQEISQEQKQDISALQQQILQQTIQEINLKSENLSNSDIYDSPIKRINSDNQLDQLTFNKSFSLKLEQQENTNDNEFDHLSQKDNQFQQKWEEEVLHLFENPIENRKKILKKSACLINKNMMCGTYRAQIWKQLEPIK